MTKFKSTCTFKSLADLSALLPSGRGEQGESAVYLVEPPELSALTIASPSDDEIDENTLLHLAASLKQAWQQWQRQLAHAAALVEQARTLRAQKWTVEAKVERTRAQFQKKKGWRTLKALVESIDADACLDKGYRLDESSRHQDGDKRIYDASGR